MKIFNPLLILLLASLPSFAIEIIQTKGNKILLDLEDESATVNSSVEVLNSQGKKIASAQIIQIKNNRAIAIINKGNTNGAAKVVLSKKSASQEKVTTAPKAKSKQQDSNSSEVYRLNSLKFSVLLAYSMNSMQIKLSDGAAPVPNEDQVSMSGTSFGISGTAEYPFRNLFVFRGVLGYDPFSTTGSSKLSACNGSNTCTVEITYLSGGAHLRFNINQSSKQFWLGLGVTTKVPISKTTSALNADDIGMTMTYTLSGGLDYYINNSMYIPVTAEYQLFQNSSSVSANTSALRVGFGWAL